MMGNRSEANCGWGDFWKEKNWQRPKSQKLAMNSEQDYMGLNRMFQEKTNLIRSIWESKWKSTMLVNQQCWLNIAACAENNFCQCVSQQVVRFPNCHECHFQSKWVGEPENTTGCRSLSGCVVMGASWLMRPRHHALGQTARKQQFISQLIAKVIVPIRPNYFWPDQQSWRAAENLIAIKL